MSYTIYIANEGGKDNPISLDAWRAASAKCTDLTVRSVVKRNGTEVYEVFLPGKREKYLWHRNGVVCTQAPNEEIMRVVFSLAADLKAGVFSENFKRYSSYEDWERKTRHERKLAAVQIGEEKTKNLKHRLLVLAFLCLCCIVGWLLSEYSL